MRKKVEGETLGHFRLLSMNPIKEWRRCVALLVAVYPCFGHCFCRRLRRIFMANEWLDRAQVYGRQLSFRFRRTALIVDSLCLMRAQEKRKEGRKLSRGRRGKTNLTRLY